MLTCEGLLVRTVGVAVLGIATSGQIGDAVFPVVTGLARQTHVPRLAAGLVSQGIIAAGEKDGRSLVVRTVVAGTIVDIWVDGAHISFSEVAVWY